MKKIIMKKQKMTFTMAAMLTLSIWGFANPTFASVGADNYKKTCETCHSHPVIPNTHHIYAQQSGTECLVCHQLAWNNETMEYGFESFTGNKCFLNCHTPMLYRESTGYLKRLTPAAAEQMGRDISGDAKTKIAALHHKNYAPQDVMASNCSRCHNMQWDPTTNAYVTNPVEGSASNAYNINNITIMLAPNELVYNLVPGGTLSLDASGSKGDITWVRWSINDQTISSGMSFVYTFNGSNLSKTYVVKLEMKDSQGRYATQDIGVNIR